MKHITCVLSNAEIDKIKESVSHPTLNTFSYMEFARAVSAATEAKLKDVLTPNK